MAVLDASALIPLARIGRLDLLRALFDAFRIPVAVREEVVVEGKPGASALAEFFEDVSLEDAPDDAAEIAELEGVAETDAAVVLLAAEHDDVLLANDRALIDVARTHDVDCWWVTTLLLEATARGHFDASEASDVLYELVDAGMNLDPQVYARLQRELEDLSGDGTDA